MIQFPFKISEFCLTGDSVPIDVADKLLQHHIVPMLSVREKLKSPITASQKSGYRPTWYEILKGRLRGSQHCFKTKGAIDWTCNKSLIKKMISLMITYTDYTRICYYPNKNFVHADYKATDGKRYYYECEGSKWLFKNYI